MYAFVFVTLWCIRLIPAAQVPVVETSRDEDNSKMDEREEVKVELIEHFNNPNDPKHVTSFDLKVSLEENNFFLCSYLIAKKMPKAEVYIWSKEEDGEGKWVEDPDAESETGGNGDFVESEVLVPGASERWQTEEKERIDQEVANGTRLSCIGRIKVQSPSGTGVNESVFQSLKEDSERDIMHLNMDVINASQRAEVRIFFETSSRKFFVMGHNKTLFQQQGKRALRGSATRRVNEEQKRRLEYYKFRCRESRETFTIKIGIVVDSSFCATEAGGNGTGDCENAAMAIVLMASVITEAQLNVRIHMATFLKTDWECDRSIDFDAAWNRMSEATPHFPKKRALYHYFTTCLPFCVDDVAKPCAFASGKATLNGLNKSLRSGINEKGNAVAFNVGVNRFRPSGRNTFLHELGHSLGFGHFLSTTNRDKQDSDSSTQYGIMDYGKNSRLEDPNGQSKYNGIIQFTPRHEDRVYGDVTTDEACEVINGEYNAWKSRQRLGEELYTLKHPDTLDTDTTTTTTTTTATPNTGCRNLIDIVKDGRCEKYRTHCVGGIYKTWVEENCKQTCCSAAAVGAVESNITGGW